MSVITPHTDASFILLALILGVLTWGAAVLWSRWDMKRAVRKEVKLYLEQEAAIKRIIGD